MNSPDESYMDSPDESYTNSPDISYKETNALPCSLVSESDSEEISDVTLPN